MACSRIPDEFPVLERDGLVLRQIEPIDGDRWHQRLNDPEGLALSGDPLMPTLALSLSNSSCNC